MKKNSAKLLSVILTLTLSFASLPELAVFASDTDYVTDDENENRAENILSDEEADQAGSILSDEEEMRAGSILSDEEEMRTGSILTDEEENREGSILTDESETLSDGDGISPDEKESQEEEIPDTALGQAADSEAAVGTNAVVQASKSSQDPPYVGGATSFATGPANPRQPKTYYLDLKETGYPTAVSWEHYGDYMQGVGILYPGDKLVILPEEDPNPGRDGSHGNPGRILVKDGVWQDLVKGDRLGPLLVSGSVTVGKVREHSYVTEITVVDCPVMFNYSGSGNSGTSGWAVAYEADWPNHDASYWPGASIVWVALPNYHPIEYRYGNNTTYDYDTGTTLEVLDEATAAPLAETNPSVIFAEDLSCAYNPIDGWKTVGPEFTINHPVLKGYVPSSVYAETNSDADRNYEPTRVSESEDGSSSQWRFFFSGANDYNWSFDNKKHGSEDDPIKIHINYNEAKTVTLKANGGKIDDRAETIHCVKSRSRRDEDFSWTSDRFDLSQHIPERDGWVFTGWFADKNCTKLISPAGSSNMYRDFNDYIEENSVYKKSGNTNCAENFDIYAGWGNPANTNISGAAISNIAAKTYTGSAVTQTPTVKLGAATLKNGTDYALSYKNNVNVGTASVYIIGKGKYWGVVSTTFKINPKPLTPVITLSQTEYIYDGEYHRPDYTVSTAEGIAITQSTDYSVYVYSQREAGEGSVTVNLRGNYTGTAKATFKVLPLAVNDFDAELETWAYTYDGSEKKPVPKDITINGNRAAYQMSYQNNVDVGTGKAVINLTGNYSGSKTLSFTIKKKTSAWNVTLDTTGFNLTYYPNCSFKPPCIVKAGSQEVTKDNYLVTYQGNDAAGTASANVLGINDRAGWYGSATFQIAQLDITDAEYSPISDQDWTGSPVTPRVVLWFPAVYYGTVVSDPYYADDFDVVYKNNTNVGSASVTVKGKRNYKGTRTIPFKIVGDPNAPQLIDISSASVAGVSLSYGYSGKAYTPALTVKVNGNTLTKDADYSVKYEKNKNPGTAKITITGKGNYTGTRIKTFEIVDCVSSIVSGKTYQLIPKNNSKTAVCSFSGRMVNNTKVYITDRSSSEAMKFKAVKNSDGTWKFINSKCELALAVQQNSTAVGKGLVLYQQTTRSAQNWKLSKKSDNSFAIINAVSNLSVAMSDSSAVKGTTLSMDTTVSSGLQRFYIAETDAVNTPYSKEYAVKAAKDKKFGLNIASSSKTDGANVNLYSYSSTAAKRFRFLYSGGGYYRIMNVNSGLVLTVKGNTKTDGTNVIQSAWAAENGQRWKVAKNSDGTVTLTNALGTVLHLSGNKTANGTNVVAKNKSTSTAQRWYLG